MSEFVVRGGTVLVDDEDVELLSKFNWHMLKTGYAIVVIHHGSVKTRETVSMHRFIMGMPPKGLHVDHINRDKRDNRKANLRICSISENMRNVPTRPHKSSKYRGVSRWKDKWQVVVRISGKPKWIGRFDTEEQAANVAAPYFDGIAA